MGFVGHAQTLTAFGNILASLRHKKAPCPGAFSYSLVRCRRLELVGGAQEAGVRRVI